MNHIWHKLLAGVAISVALTTVAAATEQEAPAYWAEEAVAFAVEAELMDGDNLRPWDVANRAELSTMLVGLFGQETQGNLDDYDDVDQSDWYYEAMSKAVAMGVVMGGDGKLYPLDGLDRETAMVMIARGFGLYSDDDSALDSFADGASVSTWARTSVAALVEAEVVHGASGNINPADPLTRQELACMIYAASQTCTILRDGDVVPTEEVAGNLVIGGDWDGEILKNLQVEGALVVHGGTDIQLTGYKIPETVVTMGADVQYTTSNKNDLVVLNGDTTVHSSLYSIVAAGDVTITDGIVNSVTMAGHTLTVEEDGRVKSVVLTEKSSIVQGDGIVNAVEILKKDCEILTEGTEIVENIDYGISDVVLTATEAVNQLHPDNTVISTTIQFTNVMESKSCTLRWYLDGVLQQTQNNFQVSEGKTATFSVDMPYTEDMPESKTLTLYVQYEDEVLSLRQTVDTNLEMSPFLQSTVETLQVEATARYTANIYSNLGLSGTPIGTFSAGETAIYDNYSGTYAGRITLADGTTGWVSYSALNISTEDYVQYTDYSEREKLNFVHNNNYSSTSDYLVWISLKTQKVNIFLGEQGSWQLLHAFSVCTGKNSTPTIAGVFSYKYYGGTWDFGSYYVKNAMIFNGGHAFHSRTYIKATGGLLDPTIGSPASHGCIRMYDADVEWMVQYIPVGTTVVVY